MKIVTCRDEGIPSLFRYQPLNPCWLRKLLRTGLVRFSNPATFNDPWDCVPCFDDTIVDRASEREQLVDWFEKAHRRNYATADLVRQQVGTRARTDPEFLRELIRQSSVSIGDGIAQQYRVYCLSARPDSILMWGHYANQHRGICLEFSTSNATFCSALKVQYCETYPSLALTDPETDEENLVPLLIKARDWQYEEEFRLISQEESHADGEDTLITRNGYIQLPRDALKSIIVGCKTTEKAERVLRKLISRYQPEVILRRAKPARGRYQIEIGQ